MLFQTPSTTARFIFSFFSSLASRLVVPLPATLVLPLSLSATPAPPFTLPSSPAAPPATVDACPLSLVHDPVVEKREGVRASGTAREECWPKKEETKEYSVCALSARTREAERKRASEEGCCKAGKKSAWREQA